ncbi:MAG: hypothetical protein ACR2LL_06780 [Nitrosopumilus sp.]
MASLQQKEITDTKSKKKALELEPLESVFPCSTSKILDFMITFSDWDYSITDIGKNSGLSFKTGFDEVKKLESQGILVKTRVVGKAILYKLDTESEHVQDIMKLAWDIAKNRAKVVEESPVSKDKKKTIQKTKNLKK